MTDIAAPGAHPPNLQRRARVLLAWLTPDEGALFLTGRRADLVTDEHRQRVLQARALIAARPAGVDQTELITDVPDTLSGYLQQLMATPAAQAFVAEGWTVVIADLTRVCAVQPAIFVDHAAERVSNLDLNNQAAVASVTLPIVASTPLAAQFDPTKQCWVFSAANPNLRVFAPFSADLQGGMKGFGFAVGVGASFLQVAKYQNRYFLRDGYHRAFGLLAAGVTLAAVFTREFQTFEELALPAGLLRQDEYLGERPPRLIDYLDDAVSAEIQLPATEKIVVVHAIELSTLA